MRRMKQSRADSDPPPYSPATLRTDTDSSDETVEDSQGPSSSEHDSEEIRLRQSSLSKYQDIIENEFFIGVFF